MSSAAEAIRREIDATIKRYRQARTPSDMSQVSTALRNLCAALAELEGRGDRRDHAAMIADMESRMGHEDDGEEGVEEADFAVDRSGEAEEAA